VSIARRRRLGLGLCFKGIQQLHLFSQIFFLGPAPLPAVAPIQYQELEAKGINFDGWLEADA